MEQANLLPLSGALQDYAWGGYYYIPELLGVPAKSGQAVAELWMGTHHRGKAAVLTAEGEQLLDSWLAEHPEALGEEVREKFGDQLPFLFKVLDVREMLSIQTHPTKAQAEAGYAREDAAGVPLNAPYRNFKDKNHKPEVMVALTAFWLLHGFRPLSEVERLLEEVPQLAPLQSAFAGRDLEKLYQYVMQMPQPQVDRILRPLHQALKNKPPQQKNTPAYWALRALSKSEHGSYDRGVFSVYLFNLVHLQAGQGIFQAAGIPHAYLEGVNVELMANSDNVFRGGLTPKHIDVEQLMQHIVLDPVCPKVLEGEKAGEYEKAYPTPTADFQLNAIELPASKVYTHRPLSVEILLLLQGRIRVGEQMYERGSALLAPAGQSYRFSAEQPSLLFKAFVP